MLEQFLETISALGPAEVKNVLTHPFNYLSMLIYTFFTNFKSYIMSMLG